MKKGVFFTFIALFIIILIVGVTFTRDKYRYREKSSAVKSRVTTMSHFVSDLEKDFERELFIGGYRALISMNSYVRMIQGYISNFDQVYSEILVNGTANGTTMDLMRQGTQGADIESWLARINEESSKLNILVLVKTNSVSVKQTSSWTVETSVNATIYVNDTKNLASWEFTKVYSASFNIQGFEDPLYTVESVDRVVNLINETPTLDFVDDTTKSPANLNLHYSNSYYVASNNAPSFIMRFSGNLTPSPYGIESMVNVDDFLAQNIPSRNRAVIDYIYFGTQVTSDYCNVGGMPSTFRIDSGDVNFYEVDLLNKTSC